MTLAGTLMLLSVSNLQAHRCTKFELNLIKIYDALRVFLDKIWM